MVILIMLTGGDTLEDYASHKANTELKALLDNSPTDKVATTAKMANRSTPYFPERVAFYLNKRIFLKVKRLLI